MPRPLLLLDPSQTLLPRLQGDARFSARRVCDAGPRPSLNHLACLLESTPDAVVLLGVEPDFDRAWAQLLALRGLPPGRQRPVLFFRQTPLRPPPPHVSVAVLDLTEQSGLAPLVAALAELDR